MQQAVVDCARGETTYATLTTSEAATLVNQQAQAQQQEGQRAAALAFRQRQETALAAAAAALHGAGAGADAAALPGLVHKLTAEPPQPLSAPELSTLARFVLRCLLPEP